MAVKSSRRLIFALGFLVLFACRLQAQSILYAATGADTTGGSLYRIDPATAAATLVGPIVNATGGGAIGITGLAFDPINTLLYGISVAFTSTGGNTVARSLFTIDPNTAVATFIGNLGSAHSDISFRSDGTLFGFQTRSRRQR